MSKYESEEEDDPEPCESSDDDWIDKRPKRSPSLSIKHNRMAAVNLNKNKNEKNVISKNEDCIPNKSSNIEISIQCTDRQETPRKRGRPRKSKTDSLNTVSSQKSTIDNLPTKIILTEEKNECDLKKSSRESLRKRGRPRKIKNLVNSPKKLRNKQSLRKIDGDLKETENNSTEKDKVDSLIESKNCNSISSKKENNLSRKRTALKEKETYIKLTKVSDSCSESTSSSFDEKPYSSKTRKKTPQKPLVIDDYEEEDDEFVDDPFESSGDEWAETDEAKSIFESEKSSTRRPKNMLKEKKEDEKNSNESDEKSDDKWKKTMSKCIQMASKNFNKVESLENEESTSDSNPLEYDSDYKYTYISDSEDFTRLDRLDSGVKIKGKKPLHFMIVRNDVRNFNGKYPVIWRRDGKTLFEKFIPFEANNGTTKYRSSHMYTGVPRNIENYSPLKVTVVSKPNKPLLVEYDMKQVASTIESDSE